MHLQCLCNAAKLVATSTPGSFADQKTCRQFKDIDRDIFVSCDELYQYLEEAETIAKSAESTKPERNPRLKKRCQTQTPEEQLDNRDEDAYAKDEEHVSKRQDLDDASYQESSSECTQAGKVVK